MEHTVRISRGDTLHIEFEEYPRMTLTLPYSEALEAVLNSELQKLRMQRADANVSYNVAQSNYGLGRL